ncbi:hypothetical protein DLAC_01987 [Tieghemostelium lacteum]|uniref:Uncharacterized protein n=1 Tax=Tieghemostelium lacteum TaxID=361077 RepID=A0A152A587_TIELA|nr:hypothetical protein DLAC_01987 [Tieghemostelium lacteum]|eukprot:KYR01398.1 hypothetical protein DLAC_01987 [Tieghemostelium lacteum]
MLKLKRNFDTFTEQQLPYTTPTNNGNLLSSASPGLINNSYNNIIQNRQFQQQVQPQHPQQSLENLNTKKIRPITYNSNTSSSSSAYNEFFTDISQPINKEILDKVKTDDYINNKKQQRNNSNNNILDKSQQQEQQQVKLFTLEQVQEIVKKALEENEIKLRAEYEKIVQQKLIEQYQCFSRYNDDYISKQMRESEFSYMS